MSFARLLSSSRRLLTFLALTAPTLAGTLPAMGQSLRFAPVINTIPSVDPTSQHVVLSGPTGGATDAAGNFYFIDSGNRLIRKIDPNGTATIFAGNGGFGATGNGAQATLASLSIPSGVATDLLGNVYIADSFAHTIRKVDLNGIITNFAGDGTAGSGGDGGAATAAQISPGSIAVDKFGDVYVTDTTASTIRMIDTTGIITTVAGGGSLAGHAADNGSALLAQINPGSIALDSAGNLFFGDDATIRVVARNDGNIQTYAGTGTQGNTGDGGQAQNAQINPPTGLSIDPAGNVYFGDLFARTVRTIDNTTAVISTLVGSGAGFASTVFSGTAADHANIDRPSGVAVDTLGNLYVVVSTQAAVYKVSLHPERFPQTRVGAKSTTQRLIVENMGPGTITFSNIAFSSDFVSDPSGLQFQGGNQCSNTSVLEFPFNNTCNIDVDFVPTAEGIRAFPLTITSNDTPSTLTQTLTSTGLGGALAMSSGQMYIVAGKPATTAPADDGVGGPATNARLNGLAGLAVDSAGNIFFSEATFCQILKVDGQTGILSVFAGALTSSCGSILSGPFEGLPATVADFPSVASITLDASNNMFVSDPWDGRILVIDGSSKIVHTFAGTGIGSGNVQACGFTADGVKAVTATFCRPGQVAIDSSGNVFFAETGNNIVRKVDPSGNLSTVAGNFASGAGFSGDGGAATSAQLNAPVGLVVNAAGDLFIADTGNQIIRKVTAATGKISTAAGFHGLEGYGGDGGLGIRSTLDLPTGLAIDAAGNVFIADKENMVVRKLDTAGLITTVAGNHSVFDGFNGDGRVATDTDLAFPNYVAVAPSGFLFVLDQSNGVVREMSPNGSLLFPAEPLHVASPQEAVTLSNVGNMPLHFDAQFPTGISGDFLIGNGSTCDFTAPLAVGANCTVNLVFQPLSPGIRTGIFAFFDDGVASPQYVALSGIGQVKTAQSITFTAIPSHVYGDPSFTITATASSGLPVTFSVTSGTGATVAGSTVTIHGIGPVTIAADQAGDANWFAATQVTRSFSISAPVIIVSALPASSQQNKPLSTLTPTYSGFAYNDDASVLSGAPILTTTATPASTPGGYFLKVDTGTLHAANYLFAPVSSTYTITAPPPPPPPPTIIITAVLSLQKRSDGKFVADVTIKNSGTGPASNVTITLAKLNGVAGVVNPTLAPLPINIGSIPANSVTAMEIIWPATIGNSGASVIQQFTGTYTGGSFGGSVHVTLP